MPNSPTGLNEAQAQLLMSQLLDGEISAEDAGRLHAYLEMHPEALDWMESLDIARESLSPTSAGHHAAATASILEALAETRPHRPTLQPSGASRLLRFPALVKPLAAAAAVTIVGLSAWIALHDSGNAYARTDSAVVEFVATDIPNASTFVYTDDVSGWTVVWVESMEPLPEERS